MRSRWLGLVVALLAAAASAWAFARLAPVVQVPWRSGAAAAVPRVRVALFLPCLIVVVWGLFHIFPRIDPRRSSYEGFRDTYWLIGNGVMLFLGAAHGLALATALGADLDGRRLLFVGAGVLITMVGNYLSRVEPNWFIGIRTPWTLSSEIVWRKTHRAMGRVFFLAGLVIATMAFSPAVDVVFVVAVTLAASAAVSIVISYLYWRRFGDGEPRNEIRGGGDL